MIENILCNIICYEFDSNVGRMQWKRHLDGETMFGMEMNFNLCEKDWENVQYPAAQLLIFAPSNYVGVYYRESESRDEFGEYQHLSHHDSCWRDDGVGCFFRLFRPRINTLGWYDGSCNDKWYSKREISKELAEHLRDITKKAHGRGLKIT